MEIAPLGTHGTPYPSNKSEASEQFTEVAGTKSIKVKEELVTETTVADYKQAIPLVSVDKGLYVLQLHLVISSGLITRLSSSATMVSQRSSAGQT